MLATEADRRVPTLLTRCEPAPQEAEARRVTELTAASEAAAAELAAAKEAAEAQLTATVAAGSAALAEKDAEMMRLSTEAEAALLALKARLLLLSFARSALHPECTI